MPIDNLESPARRWQPHCSELQLLSGRPAFPTNFICSSPPNYNVVVNVSKLKEERMSSILLLFFESSPELLP